MRNVRNTLLALILAFVALPAAIATPRLATKRVPERVRGFIQAPAGSTIARLGIGSPNNFAWLNSWVTSDGLDNDFSTDFIFYNDEVLSLVGGVYTLTSNDVTISIDVKDDSGTTQFSDSFTGAPAPDTINFIIFEAGIFPAGAYKVTFKAKQGSKVVGTRYWVGVFPPPTP